MKKGKRFKLPLRTILNPNFRNALAKLGGETMPIKERYAIARTLRSIGSEAETFEKLRGELVKKFGVQNDPNNPRSGWEVKPGSENFEKYFDEVRKLEEVEAEIYLDHALPITDGCPLTANELAALNDIIEEPK